MRIHIVKISGFRPIPFCATFEDNDDGTHITWDADAFSVTFPTGYSAVDQGKIEWDEDQIPIADLREEADPRLLSTMIGANSSGKSSVLNALETFFSSSSKLSEEYFNEKALKDADGNENYVIVEVTAVGRFEELEEWHEENCCCVPVISEDGNVTSHLCRLTMTVAWTTKSRKRYIKCDNGHYEKIGTKDYNCLFARKSLE